MDRHIHRAKHKDNEQKATSIHRIDHEVDPGTVYRCIKFKDILLNGERYASYISDDGIYSPMIYNDSVYYQLIVPKYLFIEAYNKWIKGEENNEVSEV